jgi:hypothetical protein
MLNPFGSQKVPGSYVNLQKRMLQRIQAAKVNDQIFEVVKQAYEVALDQEGILLNHPERKRLLSQLLKLVLDDMIKKLDDRSKSA